MLVYKFGGASVKDAKGVINLANIVKRNAGQQMLIVVSAMGKTPNALEKLTNWTPELSPPPDSVLFRWRVLAGDAKPVEVG